ncbi:MAG TPA: phytanoyl-CoA dioxygenase family protein [Chthonomonadaceae bacterium]|nr:phytanoyl-CoA dioxygenase family protein [Chthonomonadaceae bacterium]
MNTMTNPVKEQFERDGYMIFRNVLDPALIQEASRHVAWLLEKNPGLRPEQLHHYLMTDDPFWVRLVGDDRLLDIAEQFIGPNIALFASHYISKPPFDGQPVLWHQDGSYWPLEPMEVVTLWLAVDDSDCENGCMRVIPGTHRLDLQQMKPRTDVENVLQSGIDTALVDESKAVDFILKAGDVSVHHPNIIHGSNANNSPRRRCGLTIRYIPTSTRILIKEGTKLTPEGRWPSAFLLRGKAVPGVNDYNPRPRYVAGKHMPFSGCEMWT